MNGLVIQFSTLETSFIRYICYDASSAKVGISFLMNHMCFLCSLTEPMLNDVGNPFHATQDGNDWGVLHSRISSQCVEVHTYTLGTWVKGVKSVCLTRPHRDPDLGLIGKLVMTMRK